MLVSPIKWKGDLKLSLPIGMKKKVKGRSKRGKPKKDMALKKLKKERAIAKAKELFPEVVLMHSDRCKKDDDNIAEALLLTHWGRRHYSGPDDTKPNSRV